MNSQELSNLHSSLTYPEEFKPFTRTHVKEVRKGTEISQIKKGGKEVRSLINKSETYIEKGYFPTR